MVKIFLTGTISFPSKRALLGECRIARRVRSGTRRSGHGALVPKAIVCRTAALALASLVFARGDARCASSAEVITWQDPVTVARSGAWARMAKLTNGSWLLIHTVFPGKETSRLRILQSTNDGRSWTRVTEVIEPGRKFDNGNLLALPDGDVLLTGRSLIDGQSYRLPVYRSTNGGGDWSPLSNIDVNEGAPGTLAGHGLWEPHLALLADGRVTVTYASEKHPGYSQIVAQKVSPDRGVTWGPEIRAVAQPGGGSLRPGMPVLTRMANGKFLLVYEVVGIGRGAVHSKTSLDGVAWPDGLGRPIAAHEAGPFVLAAEDGRVFVTSCANVLSVSDDFGGSWQHTGPPPFPMGFKYSWPALYQFRAGEVDAIVSSGGIRLRHGSLAAH